MYDYDNYKACKYLLWDYVILQSSAEQKWIGKKSVKL